MRNEIIPISILLALLLPPLALAAPGEANGTVTYVVDGDTINVQIKGCNSRIGNISVRLADIDCPEMNSSNGTRCKQYTYQELNGSSVTLDLDDKTGKDRFNRWVAVVFYKIQMARWITSIKCWLTPGMHAFGISRIMNLTPPPGGMRNALQEPARMNLPIDRMKVIPSVA